VPDEDEKEKYTSAPALPEDLVDGAKLGKAFNVVISATLSLSSFRNLIL